LIAVIPAQEERVLDRFIGRAGVGLIETAGLAMA
jgi:hypothetical protein